MPTTRHVSHAPQDYACPFCDFIESIEIGTELDGALLRPADVIIESNLSIAFMSVKWWPNNPGHALVVPKQHFENIFDIPDENLADVAVLCKALALGMKKAFGCDGISTRQHNEPAGNQDVWHYHQHIIPRWEGDDFYHLQGRFVSPNERLPFADKL